MHPVFLLLFVIHWLTRTDPVGSKQIGVGIQPAIATDPGGRVHVVYGKGSAIFYTVSRDGHQFSAPVQIDSLAGLHLGASRGPQIAATAKSVVITAIDKSGNVWAYALNRARGPWQPRVRLTDIPDVAKEGFVALSAGSDNVYNAVWLDLRTDNRNKLVGARSTNGGRTWSANQVLYQSPDGTVCECCQPSVVSQGKQVAVMFRNFLNGSRDMYLLQSRDGGHTFGKAEKLGQGTWKLNACPMDGGGLSVALNGAVTTVWRRENKLFAAKQHQAETELGEGKNAKIVATKKGDYVVFQRAGQVMTLVPGETQPKTIAPGGYPKVALLSDDSVLCLWEQNGVVWAQIIQ